MIEQKSHSSPVSIWKILKWDSLDMFNVLNKKRGEGCGINTGINICQVITDQPHEAKSSLRSQWPLGLLACLLTLLTYLLTNSLTHSLTHSMMQDIISKADSHSVCQKI
jgi:hypothetical protein